MQIFLNGREIQLDSVKTVEDLIDYYQLAIDEVAVELNLEIIPRSDFKNKNLKNGDKIELVEFVGGG